MFSRVCNYQVISRVLAAFLLFAGATKFHEFLTIDYNQISLFSLLFGTAETLLAVWLVFGFYPQWSRLVACAAFLVFANVTFSQALAQKASCGCFGRMVVNPWLVFGLDLAVVGLLLYVPGVDTAPRKTPKLLPVMGALATGVILAGCIVGAIRLVPWRDNADPQSPEAHRLLAKVCDEITNNHARYQSVEFRLRRVILSPNVAKEENRTFTDDKGNVTAIVKRSPRVEQSFHYIIRGPDFRREVVAGLGVGSVDSVYRGCALDYTPSANRAVGRDADVAGASSESIDPRCLGFDKPLLSVPDWLYRQKLTSVQLYRENDDEGVEIRALVTVTRGPNVTLDFNWILRFSAHNNYLPIQIEEYYVDGRRSRLGQFTYRRLPGDAAWFLKSLRVTRWPGKPKSTTTDPEEPVAIIEYEIADQPILDKAVPDSAFDFALPKNVSVTLSTKKMNFAHLRSVRTFFDLLADASEEASQIRRKYWPYVLALDLLLLFATFCSRKYIKL
jgi:hypothetical protein